jgi:SAM-dependent methyltransferase
MIDSELSGPWSSEMYAEHLPESIAFDESLIKSFLNFYTPQKTLDLGCGLGYFVSYLREQRIDAWGVEAEDMGTHFKAPGYQIKKDLSQPFDLQEKYDLVICLEVVEHISRDFEDTVFDNITRHASQYLLFSGATVGQQGTGHINERPERHWFAHLTRRGFVLRHQDSINLRLACTLPWYTRNVTIWERVRPSQGDWADQIAERDSRIMSFETALQNRLAQTQTTLEETQRELHQTQEQLKQALTDLITFQRSRFWNLHQTWLRIEKALKMLMNRSMS